MGSPNCSAAAWLVAPDRGGNVETALVYDSVRPNEFDGLLDIFNAPSLKPEQAPSVKGPAVEYVAKQCPYDLVGLRWDDFSLTMMALIAPEPPVETKVALLLGAERISMRPARMDGAPGWTCEIASGLEFAASEFAKVQLDNGKQHWVTDPRWIDHLAELHHSTQAARFLEPIRGLENTASSAEQRRILHDLQMVAQALFTDFASFRDICFGKAQRTADEKEALAPPVDPSEIIRSLKEHEELGPVGSGSTASASITGILRILFESERSSSDTTANDEDLDEGQIPDSGSGYGLSNRSPKEDPQTPELVNAKLQARLAAQMESFLANLSNPEFAQKCSATQMIQAVCFPLAVSLRGRHHGWVSDESAEMWARKVVAVLFRGKTVSSSGLLRAVEQRYAERGRAGIFREIVGDGTLWIVLIATLANSEWHEVGNVIEKPIAIREVFKDPSLEQF